VTDTLNGPGKLMGIPLLDHIIVGPSEEYYSFAEHGLLRDLNAKEQMEKALAREQRKKEREER